MAVRPRFDVKRKYVVARGFTYSGLDFEVGDPFPPVDGSIEVPRTHLERQYGARAINMLPVDAEPVEPEVISPVSVTALPGGYYEVSAPWMEAPTKVRGKANAEAEQAAIEQLGPPLGWIEGGSDVVVEQLNETTFTVAAPWLDDFESFDSREAAEARQKELHAAGAPEGWVAPVEPEVAAVLVTVLEDKFVVTAPWLEQPEEFADAAAAEARQVELREAGPPEGWVAEGGAGEAAAGGETGTAEQPATE